MKNIKTIALAVIAVLVVGACIVLVNVTDFKIEDAYAAARIVPNPEGSSSKSFTPKTPAPKPSPSNLIATIVVGTGVITNKPTPTTTKPNTTRVDTTTAKPPARNVTGKAPAITPRTENPSTNPPAQPVRNQPSTGSGGEVKSTAPFRVSCPDDYTLSNGQCYAKCAQTGFLGLCTKPKCPPNQVMNSTSKLCEVPVQPKCPDNQTLTNGKCVDKPVSVEKPDCIKDTFSSSDATKCCSGKTDHGRCTSTNSHPVPSPVINPPTQQPSPKPNCPPQNRWCVPGNVMNGGKSGQLICSDVYISSECGVVRTLVTYKL